MSWLWNELIQSVVYFWTNASSNLEIPGFSSVIKCHNLQPGVCGGRQICGDGLQHIE
jgi:hypothetical protein